MSTTVFRSAQDTPAVETTQKEATREREITGDSSDVEVSPLLFNERDGRPYITEHLDLKLAVDRMDTDDLENAETIDGYFKQLVEKGDYENTRDSYKSFMKKLERQTNATNSPGIVKMGRIAEFIRYIQRLDKYA